MKRILLAFSILLSATLQLVAQTAPPSNLSGEELKAWLRTNWYDGKRVVLSYDAARGKMYNYVDNYDSKVTCVYSGYQEAKPYSESNTSTSMANINCEHTVPQSWFNEVVRMRSDIHHLFPTVIQWNSDRGSDPFAEIPDNQTTKWMRGTSSQSTIPTSNIDEYSEDTNTQFEPREDHKGNLARSVFYFYTMHAGQSFDSGKGVISAVADINTLYQWHIKDPVDDRERERNRRVEIAQGNRNPYIDYPELVAKAWGLAPVNCSPATQISNLSVSQKTTSTITLNWANGSGDRRLIVVKEGSAVNFTPTGSYNGINSDFTAATDQGNGQRIVYYNSGNSVTITGLKANTTYYVQAFESCATGNTYNTTSAPTINATTPDYACTGTPTAATALASANIAQNGFTLNWTNGSGDGRIVVIRKDEAPAFVPVAGTTYNSASANYSLAASLADGSKLVYSGTGNNVAITGLQAGSLYFVKVYESCSNGNQYETAAAQTLAVTTTAASSTPVGDGNVLVMQDFNGTANDGWVVTSGFDDTKISALNTGYPDGQRLRSGKSLQITAAATAHTLELSDVNVTGKQDVYLQLYNSSVATTSGNGIENSDLFEVYVALNGADYSATPEIKITGTTTSNNIQYGMNGTATITTAAGTPVEKIFSETGALPVDKAPSILRVTIPNGTTSVKAKLVIKANSDKEIWNVDDIALLSAAATTPTDCDEFALEGHAGESKTFYTGQSVTIGAEAKEGYSYSWSPVAGLSDATAANPTLTLTTPGTYVYTVTATKNGCASTAQVTLTVQALAAPVVADVAICSGQSATLEVSNLDPVMVYNWYQSETSNIAVGRGGVYYTGQLTATRSYYVEAVNPEGIASTRTKVKVTVGGPVAVALTGPTTACAGETITYTSAVQGGVTNYTWSVPANWTIVAGAGTATITVKATGNSGNVTLNVANNCGESKTTAYAVTINEVPAKAVITQTGNQLTASTTGTTYEWKKDGITIADAKTQTITITEAGNYTVSVVGAGNCASVVSDVFAATLQPTAIEDEIAAGVVVAPNPARGKFSITTEEQLQHAEIVITNLLGSVVYRTSMAVLNDKLEVDLSKLPAGLYLVQLQAKKIRLVRKVLLTK
ncbi:endonuclease [Pontibacter fetidus]|uniref:T9SS type A sorting domain-containing protein n=1 Tax=Pontibacter fetidus TaxID=2700082 RepID=A0A6B2H2W1_9BACT|nr:endonuclease [Pontibacter fetidus]NDK54956.1 T9SS type A sorting domain-containing protein [Pontibacter fetidus]